MSMSRFVTPAKISLLVLIHLYTSGAVPNEARMAVLEFLTPHTTGSPAGAQEADLFAVPEPEDRWAQAEKAMSIMEAVDEFEKLLTPYSAADGVPGRSLWDAFLQRMWAIDSLHELHSLFQNIPSLLTKTKEELQKLQEAGEPVPAENAVLIRPRSPFGMFVRRCESEFNRLKFSDTVLLWKDFIKYRQPTAEHWKRRNSSGSEFDFDSVLVTGQHEWEDRTAAVAALTYGDLFDKDGKRPFAVSTDDIEGLLEFQVENMQKMGVRVPLTVRRQYEKLIRSVHLQPSLTHYISFLESWRGGDYAAALDNVHQYFDYTMNDKDRQYYQYALLNVAILQADFGCYKEAIDAMLQAVLTARETKDNACLNFALNWLFQFGRTHTKFIAELESNNLVGSSKESLTYLRLKSREYGMWTIALSSLLSEAKLGLASGDDISVSLEFMARASRMIICRKLEGMMGAYTQVSLAFWDRFGLGSLLSATCDVFLRTHAHRLMFEDELKITCRLAGQLASRGQYDDALDKLDAIEGSDGLRGWRPRQYLEKFRGLIKLRRAMHHADHIAADTLLHQLMQDQTDAIEPEISAVASFLHVDCLARKGHLDEAFARATELTAKYGETTDGGGGGDVALRIRLMLVKAHLYDRAGRSQRGLTLALRAASAAWRARLMSLLWPAIGAVANALHATGEFAAAEDLLDTVLPRAMETDGYYVVGTLLSTLANAQMGLAGREHAAAVAAAEEQDKKNEDKDGATTEQEMRELKKIEYMTRACETLQDAYAQFAAVEDVEMMCEVRAKQATIMRALGDEEASEAFAAKYLEVKEMKWPS